MLVLRTASLVSMLVAFFFSVSASQDANAALPSPESFIAIPTWLWGFMLLVGGGALGWIITVERRLVKFETLLERIGTNLDTLACVKEKE